MKLTLVLNTIDDVRMKSSNPYFCPNYLVLKCPEKIGQNNMLINVFISHHIGFDFSLSFWIIIIIRLSRIGVWEGGGNWGSCPVSAIEGDQCFIKNCNRKTWYHYFLSKLLFWISVVMLKQTLDIKKSISCVYNCPQILIGTSSPVKIYTPNYTPNS